MTIIATGRAAKISTQIIQATVENNHFIIMYEDSKQNEASLLKGIVSQYMYKGWLPSS